MTEPMPVQQVLLLLASEIRHHGHYRGEYEARQHRACLVVNDTLITLPNPLQLLWGDALEEMRRRTGAITTGDLVTWNDSHPTDEVLAMLEQSP